MLKTVGVIPARYGSTRFPGKPLALIKGKSLIERVYTAASKNKNLQQLIVATDDQRIFDHVVSFGGKVVLTDESIQTGTDRVWQAVQNIDTDIVINIQGDEPLLDINWLDAMIESFDSNDVQMTTLAKKIVASELDSTNTVKLILDHNQCAIYFSRFPIPYSRNKPEAEPLNYKHIGLYAYRKSFLKTYCAHSQVEIEKAESLEQLRALYMGAKIKVIEVFEDAIGVDHPKDIERVEKLLSVKGLI